MSVGPGVSFTTAYDHDNTVTHNKFHDLGEGVIMDFGCVHFANYGGRQYQSIGDTFSNNICHDMTHANDSVGDVGGPANGIYIDQYSQKITAAYNLVYRASGALFFNNASTDPNSGQNLCANNGSAGCENTVSNNVFAYSAHVGGTQGSPGQGAIKRGGQNGVGDSFLDFTFKHNIVYNDLSTETDPQWVPDSGLRFWDCAAGADCTQYFNFLSNDYWNTATSTLSFYTNTPTMTWMPTGWRSSPHPNEDGPDNGGTAQHMDPVFSNPGCQNGNDTYNITNTALTTAMAFDVGGFANTYTAGRNSSATICTTSGSCPAVTATFPLLLLQCSSF